MAELLGCATVAAGCAWGVMLVTPGIVEVCMVVALLKVVLGGVVLVGFAEVVTVDLLVWRMVVGVDEIAAEAEPGSTYAAMATVVGVFNGEGGESVMLYVPADCRHSAMETEA